MRTSYLTALLMASGLLMAAPALAQGTTSPTSPAGDKAQAQKQHTDGEDVTGNNNFPSATTRATKQRTDGEDVTGNNNFPAASK